MYYTLIEELADCNFPQGGNGTYDCKHGGHAIGTRHCEQDVYVPTLSELIEACGKPFGLTLNNEGEWYAQNTSKRYYGSTPEEAVARLWLALQKERAS